MSFLKFLYYWEGSKLLCTFPFPHLSLASGTAFLVISEFVSSCSSAAFICAQNGQKILLGVYKHLQRKLHTSYLPRRHWHLMWGLGALLTKKPEFSKEPKVTIGTIRWQTPQNKTKKLFKTTIECNFFCLLIETKKVLCLSKLTWQTHFGSE